MNNATILGRLTKDVEFKVSEKGNSVAFFSIAVDRRGDGNEVDFFNVVCFNSIADNVNMYCAKGHEVLVTGAFQLTRKTDPETQITKKYYTLVANYVKFLRKPAKPASYS